METFALSFNSSFPPSSHLSFAGTTNFPKTNLTTAPTSAVKSPRAGGGDDKILAHESRKTSLHEMIFKPLHNLISSFKGSHLPPLLDPKHVLSGGFSPVDEVSPTACEVVVGSLPPCLDGAYLQNGPNPGTPRGPYHVVDGDGMIHATKISGGEATFGSRFVKTNKYVLEHDLGYPVYPNILGSFNSKITASLLLIAARVLTGQFNPFINGVGTANTSLALIGGQLYALVETDVPYQIKITPDGDIATVRRRDFESAVPELFQMMTAHPKLDPDTGETFAFRYLIMLEALEILRGNSIMKADLGKVPKLGVIPRYAEDENEMYWVDAPGLNLLHTDNSWEEEDDGGEIVIVATNLKSVEHVVEDMDMADSSMEKIVIDVKTKVVTRYPLSDQKLDFPVINPKYAGKKNSIRREHSDDARCSEDRSVAI